MSVLYQRVITPLIRGKYKEDKWTVYSSLYPISALFSSSQTQTLYKKQVKLNFLVFFFPSPFKASLAVCRKAEMK